MKTYRIILTSRASISSFPSSDTLFGAICWGIRTIYGEETNYGLNKILKGFNDSDPNFILSSTFPLVRNSGNEIFFYPRPIIKDLTTCEIEEISKIYEKKLGDYTKAKVNIIGELKKFKRANFVSEGIFIEMLKGKKEKILFEEYLDGKIFDNIEKTLFNADYLGGKIKLVNKMLLTDEEYKKNFSDNEKPKVFKKVSVQKNSLDRISMSTTGEGQTFYSEEYFLASEVNLYFLVKTNDIKYLMPILKYLEDAGIGRDRFTGKGNFKFNEPEEIKLPNNEDENKFITLSRYIPNLDEIDINEEKMFYELLPYRSKVESIFEFKGDDIFKDKIIYVKEGSVFEAKERKNFYGFTPIVKELKGKKIFQYGLSFPIFGKIGR